MGPVGGYKESIPYIAIDLMDRANEVLREHWGYDAFRGPQARAIEAAAAGRDVLVVMATGGGKSLCLQVGGVPPPRPPCMCFPCDFMAIP